MRSGPNTYVDSSAAVYDEVVSAIAPGEPFASWVDSKIDGKVEILDVGAGTGLLTKPMSDFGHRMTALDASTSYLDILKNKVPSAEIVNEDFRKFAIDKKFPAITVSANTFYSALSLQDKIDLLRSMRKHLVLDGRIYMDVTSAHVFERASSDIKSFTLPLGVDRSVTITQNCNRLTQEVMTIYLTSGFGKLFNFHEVATWASSQEIELMAMLSGLKVESVVGSYDGTPVNEDSKNLLITLKSDHGTSE